MLEPLGISSYLSRDDDPAGVFFAHFDRGKKVGVPFRLGVARVVFRLVRS